MVLVLDKQVIEGRPRRADLSCTRSQDWMLFTDLVLEPGAALPRHVSPAPGLYRITTGTTRETTRVRPRRSYWVTSPGPRETVEVIEIVGDDPSVPGSVRRGQAGTAPVPHPYGSEVEAL